jgi:hypothetical protein
VTLADNRVAGDVLTASNTAANFADKNVGTGKAVSVSGIALTGTDAGNYSVNTTAATTADITQRALTVSATGQNKVYDGGTAAGVTLTRQPRRRRCAHASNTAASFGDKNVGTGKAVSVSGIAVTGTDAGNYSFNTTAATTANITQRALTVGATAQNRVYDGGTAAVVTLGDNRVAGDVLRPATRRPTSSTRMPAWAKPSTSAASPSPAPMRQLQRQRHRRHNGQHHAGLDCQCQRHHRRRQDAGRHHGRHAGDRRRGIYRPHRRGRPDGGRRDRQLRHTRRRQRQARQHHRHHAVGRGRRQLCAAEQHGRTTANITPAPANMAERTGDLRVVNGTALPVLEADDRREQAFRRAAGIRRAEELADHDGSTALPPGGLSRDAQRRQSGAGRLHRRGRHRELLGGVPQAGQGQ